MCMSAPLPGYRSTTPIVPARSPAVAVDLFVALGGRLVQMRGAQEAKDGPALTKINRPPTSGAEGPASGPELPAYRFRASQSLEVLRQQAYARPGRIRGDRPTTRCSRSPHIRPRRHDVRLDRLPKDHAICAAAGIVGDDRNSIAIGVAEELHAQALVKCDGVQI